MIHQGVKARGQAVRDILSLTVREELKQEYKLNLSEMYSLMDYISELEDECDMYEAIE